MLNVSPFDLHVLSTPPAFVLSQDQTLRKDYLQSFDGSCLFLEIIVGSHIWLFYLTLFSFQGTTLPDGASVKCAMDGLAFDRLLAFDQLPGRDSLFMLPQLASLCQQLFSASFNLFWLFPAAA